MRYQSIANTSFERHNKPAAMTSNKSGCGSLAATGRQMDMVGGERICVAPPRESSNLSHAMCFCEPSLEARQERRTIHTFHPRAVSNHNSST